MISKTIEHYLNRYAYEPCLESYVKSDSEIAIVIPCFKEPEVIKVLQSLAECEKPLKPIQVIVVINQSIEADNLTDTINKKTYDELTSWAKRIPSEYLQYHILCKNNLPQKHAGVGLARKIGMDEAVRLLKKESSLIVNLDADCQVASNYLVELEEFASGYEKSPGCSIYFEHPISENLDKKIYDGIIYYELFLRYYRNALRWAQFPFSFHTVGSSMAVRVGAYCKQGGMNRRKAAEDFYFINRIVALGGYKDLNTTSVHPSPRTSDRVPFGTGKAISNWIENTQQLWLTYHPNTFLELKSFLGLLPELRTQPGLIGDIPKAINNFLLDEGLEMTLEEARNSTSTPESFLKRIYQWFDGLKVLKYVHFARDNYFPQVRIEEAALWLAKEYDNKDLQSSAAVDLLIFFRRLDRHW